MRQFAVTLAISLSLVAPMSVYSKDIDIETKLQQTLESLATTNQLIGTHFVAIVNKDGLQYIAQYSGENLVINDDTPFLVASHTKAMTSSLVARLHQQNQLNLYQPLSAYEYVPLTNTKLNLDELNLHKLLTHSAGFTSIQHTFKSAFLGYENQQDLTDSLNRNTLVAPDYRFRYSNTGPIVAAMIAERKLDSTWQSLMEQQLFKPLEMNNTTTSVSGNVGILPAIVTNQEGSSFLQGHHKIDKTMHASGGVVSTLADMSKWLTANITEDKQLFVNQETRDLLHTSQVEQSKTYFTYERIGYSLGWDIATYNGEKILTRFGSYGGYSIHVSFMPEHDLGVIAFTNQDISFALPHVIANYAYNTLLAKENTDSTLEKETERLSKSIMSSLTSAPKNSERVGVDNISEAVIGMYENEADWPRMVISKDGELIKVTWGELDGALLKVEGIYAAQFGPLKRTLKINVMENGSVEIENGSIKYKKRAL